MLRWSLAVFAVHRCRLHGDTRELPSLREFVSFSLNPVYAVSTEIRRTSRFTSHSGRSEDKRTGCIEDDSAVVLGQSTEETSLSPLPVSLNLPPPPPLSLSSPSTTFSHASLGLKSCATPHHTPVLDYRTRSTTCFLFKETEKCPSMFS